MFQVVLIIPVGFPSYSRHSLPAVAFFLEDGGIRTLDIIIGGYQRISSGFLLYMIRTRLTI
jgi:hypothetical protein